jgi:hypothetical protein
MEVEKGLIQMLNPTSTPAGTPVVYRNFNTKRFEIIKFGDVSLKVVPDDFKDINEARAWVQEQGGTMGERKWHPFIGGYCEVSLPTREEKMEFAGVINSEETISGLLPDGRRIFVQILSIYPMPSAEKRDDPEYWLKRLEAGDFADEENDPLVWVEKAKGRTN